VNNILHQLIIDIKYIFITLANYTTQCEIIVKITQKLIPITSILEIIDITCGIWTYNISS